MNGVLDFERYELREDLAYHFTPDRRQFLQSLGAGLLFVFAADAQNAAPETRIHVGQNGHYTVLTGKIEEGQGARTEVAMAAAEELGVPLSRVTVLMADTSQVPNDGITAGSGTTPRTIPAVRRAAATVRGELDNSAKPIAPADWKLLGTPQVRLNSRDIVTGSHQFPSDIQREGMLYGAVLRAPAFGAKLLSVDEKAAGDVIAVRDGDFVGCAATTSFAARQAMQKIAATAKWDVPTTPVNSVNLFDHLKAKAQAGAASGRNRPIQQGDAEAALQQAQRKLEATYTAAYIQHAPMEPRAAVAEWRDGSLTVWTGTSNPFSVRDQLAQAFQIPAAKVKVLVPDFGGGFGGKHTGEAALEAARLARAAEKPVSLRWTRAEEFTWAYCRPAAVIEVRAALDQNNAIAAWDFTNINSGGSAIESPYKSANHRIRFLPSDSPLRQGSYRALASTANNFARESHIDELALAAKIDPLEFRLQHLDNDRIREVLQAAARKFGWKDRVAKKIPNRGVGLACGLEKNSVVAACVEIEIDPRTHLPRLLEICEAYECGAILNPLNLRQQVEGAIVMGLGAVLGEGLRFEQGRITNARFSAYKVPRFHDVPPKMEIVLVDKKDAAPIGAGETPIIAVAPAMANAVFAATGYRPRSLPFAPVPARA